ncbi:MAG: heavy metal translocating P-type ATPase metal-binding domain-containing protein [Bacteroidetes bacterium]|nr:heavy metal translocating P-type ATPase metal-binding domain-containing protein [Bacteroidota bacterium]
MQIADKTKCYHCGDECEDTSIMQDEKYFCCTGCKLVYEILNENNLCTYYDLNSTPGFKQSNIINKRFAFLDEPEIARKLITFKNKNEVHVTFHIPAMHCSSCIWLLEHFKKIDSGVLISRIDFLKKELHLVFDNTQTSLREVVEKLSQTGYEPLLSLDSIEKKETKKANRNRIVRIGVAGFCAGNIMMLSFPEYFSSGKNIDSGLQYFFSYLNLLLALPVFFYSANEFFIKSWKAIRHKTTSIDIPIAIGLIAIFLRSTYEIITHTGAGYFDSGSGLVFFMLIGRWFQDFTFDSMSFDRDYKSYFPIAVTRLKDGEEKEISVNELKVNDRILIRNNEIIPVDALLLKGRASVDYHFVTGESIPISHEAGENIYAGGRQTAGIIELQVTKEVSQSHLTQLWNRSSSQNELSRFEKLVNNISRWFIVVVLLIAFGAGAYWWNTDIHKAINAFTAVLVITCPCALALSAPFTYGNILRMLGKKKIYLRNYKALEKLADVDTVVFDKTGTLTQNNSSQIEYEGDELNADDKKLLYSLTRQSSHPLSKLLTRQFKTDASYKSTHFTETPGEGIEAVLNGITVKAGTAHFAGVKNYTNDNRTSVFINISDKKKGRFVFLNSYRAGVEQMAEGLKRQSLKTAVLTGDKEQERKNLEKIFGTCEMQFNQKPEDKLNYINNLQSQNHKVLMIGDGLNDAGALLAATSGISITDNTNNFTPASDTIMDASHLEKLPQLINLSKSAVTIIIISFIISLLYNLIGISYAVTGTLSPLFAAILMPISTTTLVLFTTGVSTLKTKQAGF